MTEQELKERGFPGGDPELLGEYRRLLGHEPDYVISAPDWVRSLMFLAVERVLKRQAIFGTGAREPAVADVPRLGNWHEKKG